MNAQKPKEQEEKRISNIIIKHWNEVRGDRPFPAEKELDPGVLETVLDNCYLVRARGIMEENTFEYVYIGKNIEAAYGDDSLTVNDHYTSTSPLTHKDKFKEVIETRKPVEDEGKFVNRNGDTVRYRQCMVPLGGDGLLIDTILCGMRYKVEKRKV